LPRIAPGEAPGAFLSAKCVTWVNGKKIYELDGTRADGFSIVSNLAWSHTNKPESLYFVEQKGDGSRSLVCISVSNYKDWNGEKPKVSKTTVNAKADEVTVSVDDKTGKAVVR
jgi:hypothetical protein